MYRGAGILQDDRQASQGLVGTGMAIQLDSFDRMGDGERILQDWVGRDDAGQIGRGRHVAGRVVSSMGRDSARCTEDVEPRASSNNDTCKQRTRTRYERTSWRMMLPKHPGVAPIVDVSQTCACFGSLK
jgi:hypothetical protein